MCSSRLRRERFNWLGCQERAGFEQPAEILFACVSVFAAAGLEAFHHFVTDLEALQLDDTDKFVAMFPDLSLLKLERHGVRGEACLS